MLKRYELTDEEWDSIAELFPPEHTGKPGRPGKDNRMMLNAISIEAEMEDLSIDGSIVQAHQHSAGAKKGGLQTK